MTLSLVSTQVNQSILIPPGAIKDVLHRLSRFVLWLDATHRRWCEPDLATYRDYLLERGLARASVKAHLATIRGRYSVLLKDNAVRDSLYALTTNTSPAEKKAFVDEVLTRLQNATDPSTAPVKTITHQDRPDAEHVRLTTEQANLLLKAPGVDTHPGLRDTALIALMLCTGIREAELCALNVDDLRQRLGGSLALHIRQGKGAKERLIPYGALEWVLAIIDACFRAVDIDEGAVFRDFYKGQHRLRTNRLTVRAVQDIPDAYPIMDCFSEQHSIRGMDSKHLLPT